MPGTAPLFKTDTSNAKTPDQLDKHTSLSWWEGAKNWLGGRAKQVTEAFFSSKAQKKQQKNRAAIISEYSQRIKDAQKQEAAQQHTREKLQGVDVQEICPPNTTLTLFSTFQNKIPNDIDKAYDPLFGICASPASSLYWEALYCLKTLIGVDKLTALTFGLAVQYLESAYVHLCQKGDFIANQTISQTMNLLMFSDTRVGCFEQIDIPIFQRLMKCADRSSGSITSSNTVIIGSVGAGAFALILGTYLIMAICGRDRPPVAGEIEMRNPRDNGRRLSARAAG
ncbi:MAG: hypothetical protein KIT27_02930 [Legionellales bacterium]|nr:hypothetical protein [Legionellales bacterium]